jgi:elongation factor P--(R)-beta-lysine ligase
MNRIEQIAEERQRINQTIRSFFLSRGYLEVETPIVVRSPGMEPNLSPFETKIVESDNRSHVAALITSPEYSMKKLLGLGMEKIFTITKVFRNEEMFGGQHQPEFSILEWYRQEQDYRACMDETEELVNYVISSEASTKCRDQVDGFLDSTGGLTRDDTKWERFRIRDLFVKYVEIDLDDATEHDLIQACHKHGVTIAGDDTQSDLFYRLFLLLVEPTFKGRNLFVYDYPKYQAALSRLTPDGRYGERFELYLNGLELCNGFTELIDSDEQRKRFEQEAQERQTLGKTIHPIDESLLALLPSIQNPTYGNALGIDRLHMVLTGRTSIDEVVLFPARTIFK